MKLLKSIVLFSVFICLSCSKEEEPTPQVKVEVKPLLTIEVPEDGGVTFHGDYSGEVVGAAGFYYSQQKNFLTQDAIHITSSADHNFSSTVNTGVRYNYEYFVRAYIKNSDGRRIESDEKSFVSIGGKAPVISSLNNSHLLDTVTIKGKNFGKLSYNSVQVLFNDSRAEVIHFNDSIIECIVPVGFQVPDPQVRLWVNEKQTVYNDFHLYTPEVLKASQAEFTLGDTISLYGSHLDTAVERTQILSGELPLEILETSRDSLRLVLPLDAATSNIELVLRAQKQEVKIDFLGHYKKPEIGEILGNIRTYDTIVFKGSNFSPLKEANKVSFDGHKAKILSASQNELKVLTPLGPYKDAKPNITYNLMDYSVIPDEQIVFQDTWLFKNQVDFSFFGKTDQHFNKNGKLYLVQKDYGDYNLSFLEFDPITLDFNKFELPLPHAYLADYPFQVVQNQATGKVYFIFNSDKGNFFELDLNGSSFIPMTDYPGITSKEPEVFLSDNKIFVTGGWVDNYDHTDKTYDDLNVLWAYDLLSNMWVERSPHPEIYTRSGDVVFQKESDTYISYGIHTTGGVSFWKYSASSDSWENLNSHESAKFGKAFFMYNGRGYAYFADPVNATPSNLAYRFDLEGNSWESIKPLNNRYYTYFNFPRSYSAFKVADKVFIGIYEYPRMKFFEADLSKLE